jgi:AcrR family transcriptional regulator
MACSVPTVAEWSIPFKCYRGSVSDESRPLSGRQAQARRNDGVILAAAREVFLRDPKAPVSAVAEAAGVGISALYRRYPSKEELLQTLCADGLRRYIEVAEQALATDLEPWDAFAGFLTGIVESDVHSLTVHLAGTFTPTEDLGELATRANSLTTKLMKQTHRAKAVRSDLDLNDLPMLFEQMSAIRVHDEERTVALRRRYLALLLDALRPEAVSVRLPASRPTDAELGERWVTP